MQMQYAVLAQLPPIFQPASIIVNISFMYFHYTNIVLMPSSHVWIFFLTLPNNFSTIWVYVCAQLLQSCPAFCNSMGYSLSGSCVHGISQARILEWVAMLSSKGSFWLRDQTFASCIIDGFFTHSSTKEANWSQFWHHLPGESIKSHRLGAQSYKMSPALQVPIANSKSRFLLVLWPTSYKLELIKWLSPWFSLICQCSSQNSKAFTYYMTGFITQSM